MRFSLAMCLFVLLAPGARAAAESRPVVEVHALLASSPAHAGSRVKLAVVARIAPGYHINAHRPSLDYLIPTVINFKKTTAVKVDRVVYPHGKSVRFAFLDSPLSVYAGEVIVGGILQVNRALKPGNYKLGADFAYQACNDHACLAPTKVPFVVTVRVAPAGIPVKPANSKVFQRLDLP